MARLLTLLLLYQSGYAVGRYISLETAVEDTKEGYDDSLYASSQGWHDARHSLVPWREYFVGVMLVTAYRQFEERVGVTAARRGAKRRGIRCGRESHRATADGESCRGSTGLARVRPRGSA
jgi:hypothetical protein